MGFLDGMRQATHRPEGGDHWWNRWGYTPGQIAANLALRVGGGLVLGPIGSKLGGMAANYYANHHNPNNPANPANPGYVDPGSLSPGAFTPNYGGIDHGIPPVQVGGGQGGSYTPGNPDPSAGGWQSGYGAGGGYTGGGATDGGYVPSQTTLGPGPGYTPPDWASFLNPPDLTVNTGNGGGGGAGGGGPSGGQHAGGMGGGGSYGGGMATSGTLGGGSVVDPSQWGAYGLGGDSGPQNGGMGHDYALQMMGGMHEGGGGGMGGGSGAGLLASFLAGKRAPVPGNTGIVPPSIRTGGPGATAVGGALPAAPRSGVQSIVGALYPALTGHPLPPPRTGRG